MDTALDELKALDAEPSYRRPWLAQQLLPDYGSALEFIFKSDARCRLVWLGIVTKRFRLKYDRFPDSSTELSSQLGIVLPHDPLSNAPFKMVVRGESVGWSSLVAKTENKDVTNQDHKGGNQDGIMIWVE